jgi:hypothetical protein
MPELKIIISAENQKALDELKQLQDKLFQLQETVKNYKGDWPLTHTIETVIPKIQARIAELQGTLAKAGVEFDNFGDNTQKIVKGSNNAGNALNDLSRIAQDAPYGFIGISNNLNPMIESFGRLVEKEKGVKNALLSMAEGLTGPAGLGLAIGAISALLVVFNKQISAAFKGSADDLEEYIGKINKLKTELYSIASKTEAKQFQGEVLVGIIGSKADIDSRKNALQMLKDLYSQSDAIKKLTIESDSKTLIAALNNASRQFKLIEEEKNNNKLLEDNFNKRRDIEVRKNAELAAITDDIVTQVDGANFIITKSEQQASIVAKYAGELAKIGKDSKEFKDSTIAITKSLSEFAKVDNSSEKVSALAKAMETFNKNIRENETLLKEGKLFTDSGKGEKSYVLKQLDAINKAIKDIAGIGGQDAEAAINKLLKQESDIYNKFYNKKPNIVTDLSTTDNKLGQSEVDINVSKISTLGTKELNPERLARQIVMLNKEISGQLEKTNEQFSKATLKQISIQEQAYMQFAKTISTTVTNAIMGMWDAMQHGENPIKAFGDMLMKIAEQLAATAIEAAILSSILATLPGSDVAVAANGGKAATGFFDIFKMLLGVKPHAEGGITTGPSMGLIGEAGPEAIMPLSKLSSFLNTSFNAGAMSGTASGTGGQFVLKGNDLVLALNRSNYSLNLRRGA